MTINGNINSHAAEEGSSENKIKEQRVANQDEDDEDDYKDMYSPLALTSDSESEADYDSMEQEEEGSEVHINHSLDVNQKNHSAQWSTGNCGLQERDSKNLLRSQEVVQHRGENGNMSGSALQSQTFNADRFDSTLVRRKRGSRSTTSGSEAQRPLQGSGGDKGCWGLKGIARRNFNQQIVLALTRLQEDMRSELEQLHTQQSLKNSQTESLTLPSNETKKKPSWWPFDMFSGTVAFTFIWPFVVQWLIQLYFQRRRRKVN